MKKSKFLLLILITALTKLGLAQDFESARIVYDSANVPLYYQDQLLVKFNPEIINKDNIDNVELRSGNISTFITSYGREIMIRSGYINSELLNSFSVYKIYHNLRTSDTSSITRLEDTIEIPKFWSTLLLTWHSESNGLSLDSAITMLNNLDTLIEFAVPNAMMREASVFNNDPAIINNLQPNLYPNNTYPNANINIDKAWSLSTGNITKNNTGNTKAIKVGIYDTGINWRHEDFREDGSVVTWAKSRVKGGRDYFITTHNQSPANQQEPYSNDHGTCVAGIIGAIRNNGIHIAGIAGGDATNPTQPWGADLYSMKVTGPGNALAPLSAICSAIVEGATSSTAIAPAIAPNLPNVYGYGLHCMNFSTFYNVVYPLNLEPLRDAIIYSFRNNVSIAGASGNDGNRGILFPSSYRDDFIMKVGASNVDGEKWFRSNYDYNLDFIAPGVEQLITSIGTINNQTQSFDGTSGATPHATGVSALMQGYIKNNPTLAPNLLAPEDVENIIKNTAKDIKNTGIGPDIFTGYGLLDAGAALEAIQLPTYQLKHYVSTTPLFAPGTTKKTSNVLIRVFENINTSTNPLAAYNIPAGNYYGDIYEITQTINITQPQYRGVLDVWKLNSISNLYGNDINNATIQSNIIAGPNCEVISWNQTSATMRGYVYQLKKKVGNNNQLLNFNEWIPATAKNANAICKMALTAYTAPSSVINIPPPYSNKKAESTSSRDASSNDIAESISIYPNPVKDRFTLQFSLPSSSQVKIELRDMTGKIVYEMPIDSENEGVKKYNINCTSLNTGFYICHLITDSYSVSRKLIIE